MKNKRGSILNQVVIQVILVGIIFSLFLFATADKINTRGVRQQVLEKEIALLVDSAEPGMEFEISKKNLYGVVQDVEVARGRIFVNVDGLVSIEGYPYFSLYSVSVREEENKFVISVNENQ